MKFVVLLLLAIVLLLLAGVLPSGDGPPDGVFRSPVFVALLGLVGLSSLACCAGVLFRSVKARRFGLKRLTFLLTHLSVVLMLAGACLKFVSGREGTFLLPVMQDHFVSTSYDRALPLDFGISATDLEISYYEPSHYDLFVIDTSAAAGNDSHEFSRKLSIPADGPLAIDNDLEIELADLKDDEGNWKPFYRLDDGSILQINRTVRHYGAVLHFKDAAGRILDEEISVNYPVTFRKWRFYLMDAKEGQSYIVLSGKRDPGWPLVSSGMWMMIVGVAFMCFKKASKG